MRRLMPMLVCLAMLAIIVALTIIWLSPRPVKVLTPKDISSWTEIPLLGDLTISHTGDTAWAVWTTVYNEENDKEDTVIYGPIEGHYPLGPEQEYFDKDFSDDEDDRWVFEFLGPKGCEIMIFKKVNGKPVLVKHYKLDGMNCGPTYPDEEQGKKLVTGLSYGGDSTASIAFDYNTGDSLGFELTERRDYGDLEYINGHFFGVKQEGDSTYVYADVLSARLAFPGAFVAAKEDGTEFKILVTKVGAYSTGTVFHIDSPLVFATPTSLTYGEMVDLQAHRINGKSYFILSTYDPVANTTHITIHGENGQVTGTAAFTGKFAKARFFDGSNRKAFIGSDPPDHTGSGSTVIHLFEIPTGVARQLNPGRIPGMPTEITAPAAGNDFSVATEDASGNTTSTTIVVN